MERQVNIWIHKQINGFTNEYLLMSAFLMIVLFSF